VLATDCISAFTPADQAAGIAYMEQMYGAEAAVVAELLQSPAATVA
jgi:hypothetical protein